MKNRVFACSAAGLSGFFFLMLFLFCAVGASYGEVVAPRVDEPPVIDGKIDEPAWEEASWQTGFSDLLGNAAEIQTRFKVIRDDKYIYFAVEAMEPRVEDIRAEVTERGGRVFADDCIEIFIAPSRCSKKYFQIIMNSIGTIYDSKISGGGEIHDTTWDSEAKVAAGVFEDRWRVEAAVPVVNLELEPDFLHIWNFNLTRERYAGGGHELSTFSELTGFHQPEKFKGLVFEKPLPDMYSWEFSEPRNGSIASGDSGGVYRAEILISNMTGKNMEISLHAEQVSMETGRTGVYETGVRIGASQTVKALIEVPIPEMGGNTLRLLLIDSEKTSARLAVRSMRLYHASAHAFNLDNFPPSPSAVWIAGEKGEMVPDITGNGYDGVLYGEDAMPERVESGFLGNVLRFRHTDVQGGPVVRFLRCFDVNPPKDEMTAAAWIKLDSDGETRDNYILNSGFYRFSVRQGFLTFGYKCGEDEDYLFSVENRDFHIGAGKWRFVAVSHDGEKVRMFVDGVQAFAAEARGYPAQRRYLYLGNFSYKTTSVTFRGEIGPIIMYGRALSEYEVLELMQAFPG